jgi:hypothetical protein
VFPLALLIGLTHFDQLHLLCLALSQPHQVDWFELALLNESAPTDTKEVSFSQPDVPELKIDDKQIVFNPADGLRWSFLYSDNNPLAANVCKVRLLDGSGHSADLLNFYKKHYANVVRIQSSCLIEAPTDQYQLLLNGFTHSDRDRNGLANVHLCERDFFGLERVQYSSHLHHFVSKHLMCKPIVLNDLSVVRECALEIRAPSIDGQKFVLITGDHGAYKNAILYAKKGNSQLGGLLFGHNVLPSRSSIVSTFPIHNARK